MKATLTNHRQTPRKTRQVADLVRGKKVSEALSILKFLPGKSAEPLAKLIRSAADNAVKNDQAKRESLVIDRITVDKGIVLKRFMPRARGRASMIRRRRAHVKINLKEA